MVKYFFVYLERCRSERLRPGEWTEPELFGHEGEVRGRPHHPVRLPPLSAFHPGNLGHSDGELDNMRSELFWGLQYSGGRSGLTCHIDTIDVTGPPGPGQAQCVPELLD